MLQEVQVFFISQLQDNRINEESLQYYKHLQYMGYNKNASFLCSLIHYAFNKQISKILDSILELINNLKNQQNYVEFANLIKQTKIAQNPIQKFFQNLYLIDQNNEIAGKILYDCCKSKNWLDGSQISYKQIANYFQMRISFLNCNEIYGIKFKDSIDIINDANKKFYYLIPELLIKNLDQFYCPQCKSKNECILLICKHKQCYKCLLKKSQKETIKCCEKINLKKYLINQMKKFDDLKEQNEKNKILLKYYESSNQTVSHTDQQLNRGIRNQQDINEIQKVTPTVDIIQECNLCFKKVYTQLFIQQDCKHQFCYDCKLEQKSQKDCPLLNCLKKIEQNELQTCLIKNNSENKKQPNQNLQQSIQNQTIPRITEQCQKCYKTFNYKLFEIKKCNHKFCISCLSIFEMKNESQYCLKQKCLSIFTKQDYKMYTKNQQSLQNSETIQINTPQQTQSYFSCDHCDNKRNEDQKYILNCGHSICQTCIIQNVEYKKPCCYLKSLDQEYQQFRKNLTTNCIGCQCPIIIKNLYQLKCQHEFCLNCCQKIYLGRPQKCIKCDRLIIFLDDLFDFIFNQKLEQSKEITNKEEQKKNSNSKEQDNEQKLENKEKIKEESKLIDNSYCINNEQEKSIQIKKSIIHLNENIIDEEDINIKQKKLKEISITPYEQKDDQIKQEIQHIQDNSLDFYRNFEEEIIIYQQIEEIKSAQERENEFCKGNCTNCNQEFSTFNRKQLINCKSHQIGVCCILIKFKNCPQCEQISTKQILIKQKLILPINPIEEESIYESNTIKYQSLNYNPLQYQQTYQGYGDQLQKLDRYRNNQNTAIKRNSTTDHVNKRVLENQQSLDDKYKLRNELVQQCSPPYVQQSYYPNKYDRINYGLYDYRNRLELQNRDYHLNSKITTGHSGRLI